MKNKISLELQKQIKKQMLKSKIKHQLKLKVNKCEEINEIDDYA